MSDETKKIIVFNGPPGVGKDYAARTTVGFISRNANYLRPVRFKMVEPLKKSVHALYGLFHSPEFYDGYKNANMKDEKHELLFRQTPREAYIAMSEKFLKPMHGEDALGKLALNRIHNRTQSSVFVFSDGGFVQEWIPIIDYVGAKNFCIVEIQSEEHSFANDSRSYIGKQLQEMYPEITRRLVHNEHGGPEEREFFRAMCCGVVAKFLDIEAEEM